jgi:hypothetical protein
MPRFIRNPRLNDPKGGARGFRFLLPVVLAISAMFLGVVPRAYGQLNITPTFDSTITLNANAAAIEADINTAISNIQGLYSNSVTIPITFVYSPLSGNSLLQTQEQGEFGSTYNNYVSLLQADAAAHPDNTALATAIASLGKGNTGGTNTQFGGMIISGAQWGMLGNTNAFQGATITISSTQPFALAGPVGNNQYDLIGGLEHEIDEVLGGGGVGSTLNVLANPSFCPGSAICTQEGSTDLYRYSAPNTGSFSTSSTATAYFSIDGGVTNIVNFNQGGSPPCTGGDFGDFAPPGGSGGGTGQLIQNACNFFGPDEAYTTSSPEYTMMEAIGWDPVSSSTTSVPEPGALPLMAAGFAVLVGVLRRKALTR